MAKIRGTHSSPGVYTQFTDLSFAAQSLGITKLGLVGETKKGPAFDPTPVSDWSDFVTKFGDTSAEKFKDSQYPKYELPYIAKSYLSASDQLYVCRVLGLSGYNAGPAFVITANKSDGNEYAVAVLRSRGGYKKYASVGDVCDTSSDNEYDQLVFDCTKVELAPYTSPAQITICDDITSSATTMNIPVTPNNLGHFTLVCYNGSIVIGKYAVSLNPGAKDYIYNVIGGSPSDGTAAVYVEELYDLQLQSLADSGKVSQINKATSLFREAILTAICDPVSDFVTIPYTNLTKKQLNQTYLCIEAGNSNNNFLYNTLNGDIITSTRECMVPGYVYTVKTLTDSTGKVSYVYVQLMENGVPVHLTIPTNTGTTIKNVSVVKVQTTGVMYQLKSASEVIPTTNISDYHEMYRCATTPWIVSEIKGDAKTIQVKKLFRFHTISDGTSSNYMVKISIANIRPDEGLFDVLVRDFNDSDASPSILESYRNLTMMPGSSNYIGLKIGTLDGTYESVSKYVIVEIIDNDMTRTCVPCGFLGYPTRDLSVNSVINPTLTYNTSYDEDIKVKKQYFGMSDITGVDVDLLYYKGVNAYTEDYINGYTNSFHLDSTLSNVAGAGSTSNVQFTVDGELYTSAITWDTVNAAYDPSEYTHGPIIGSESEMEGCLFEDKNKRKFTVYPCGGFDGWDVYRGARTTGNDFKFGKYKGKIVNGYGQTFSRVDNAKALALDSKSITSDYYAFLAAANQFENPDRYTINLFATPGIDYVNDEALSNDILDMVETKRGDSLYVMTTPDKPFGASDNQDEMYTSNEAVDNLVDAGIDTYYAATYYPWVKYYDSDNNVYVNLPATKDALRNMADVDNKRYPWYAPAGIEKGNVDCKKMHFFAKIEDEDNLYDGRINPLKTFSEDGVKLWGNKTMYTGDTPMNRINVVRLMLYMRKLIVDASRTLIFEQNDTTLKDQFESTVNPILAQIKNDRGITAYKLQVSQTPEQMDAHELSAKIAVKPTPTLEYIEIDFVVTPQGVEFED